MGERISSNLPISGSSSSLLDSSLSLLDQSTSSTSALEQSLEEAESRIAGLLSVKDRLVTVQVCVLLFNWAHHVRLYTVYKVLFVQ